MEERRTLLRELRPHATWRGIELLWDLARAALLAALIALWQWFIHHLDVVTIVLVFVTCLGLLIWRDISRRTNRRYTQTEPEIAPVRSPVDTSLKPLPVDAPRLRVDCVSSKHKGKLIFRSDKPGTVQAVRPLLSRDKYEMQHEFSIIPDPPFAIDANNPVECTLGGLRRDSSPDLLEFLDILRRGAPETSDSVVIDYSDDHGNSFSRSFEVRRQNDDSVTWLPAPSVDLKGQTVTPDPAWQDLAELRHKLVLASAYEKEHRAAIQYARELEEERRQRQAAELEHAQEVQRMRGEVIRPRIVTVVHGPQGGMLIRRYGEDWQCFGLLVTNSDLSNSACDIAVSFSFRDASGKHSPRDIERALFVARDETDAANVEDVSTSCYCLPPGKTAECLLTVWRSDDPIQVVREWPRVQGAFDPVPYSRPMGDVLPDGEWICKVTTLAQNVENYGEFKFIVGQGGPYGISGFRMKYIAPSMPPPGYSEPKASR
jgi:hypothetical protein